MNAFVVVWCMYCSYCLHIFIRFGFYSFLTASVRKYNNLIWYELILIPRRVVPTRFVLINGIFLLKGLKQWSLVCFTVPPWLTFVMTDPGILQQLIIEELHGSSATGCGCLTPMTSLKQVSYMIANSPRASVFSSLWHHWRTLWLHQFVFFTKMRLVLVCN